jgi:nucleotide-binding universal stress UspA family protein
MAYDRVVVGLDGSASARCALRWAVREAVRRRAVVFVVTAVGPDELAGGRKRLERMQRTAIESALVGVPVPPVVGREIIVADPVTAISHAASIADVVVLGSDEYDGLLPTSLAARVAVRLSERRRYGGTVPLIVVPTEPPIVKRTPPRRGDLVPAA